MTLTINLTDAKTATLAAKARALGLSPEQYVVRILEHDLVPDWLQKSWETSIGAGLDQMSQDEIESEISGARRARHT